MTSYLNVSVGSETVGALDTSANGIIDADRFCYNAFSLSKSSEPRVAFVTAVGFLGTISVAIIEVNAIMLNVRDGVRHVDDPSVRDAELQYSGGWEHREAYFKRQAEERQRREKKAVAAN
jgi:hypothetical protein